MLLRCKIRMHLTASGTSVSVKCGPMEPVNKVNILCVFAISCLIHQTAGSEKSGQQYHTVTCREFDMRYNVSGLKVSS
jgi:hypothetical protein